MDRNCWEEIEFGCNDCSKFFIARLHRKFHDDCLIECPNCGRRHPRKVSSSSGELTGDPIERLYRDGEGKRLKRNFKEDSGEVVLGLKCTVSDESRFDKKNFAKDGRDKGGFLSRLWVRMAANEKS